MKMLLEVTQPTILNAFCKGNTDNEMSMKNRYGQYSKCILN